MLFFFVLSSFPFFLVYCCSCFLSLSELIDLYILLKMIAGTSLYIAISNHAIINTIESIKQSPNDKSTIRRDIDNGQSLSSTIQNGTLNMLMNFVALFLNFYLLVIFWDHENKQSSEIFFYRNFKAYHQSFCRNINERHDSI